MFCLYIYIFIYTSLCLQKIKFDLCLSDHQDSQKYICLFNKFQVHEQCLQKKISIKCYFTGLSKNKLTDGQSFILKCSPVLLAVYNNRQQVQEFQEFRFIQRHGGETCTATR